MISGKHTIGRNTRKDHALRRQAFPVSHVDFIAVAVTFEDVRRAINVGDLGARLSTASYAPSRMVPPRSPVLARASLSLPRVHSSRNPTTGSLVCPNSVELASLIPTRLRTASIAAICMPKQMPKYGIAVHPRKLGGGDHPFGAAHAEAARHQDAVHVLQGFDRVGLFEHLGYRSNRPRRAHCWRCRHAPRLR